MSMVDDGEDLPNNEGAVECTSERPCDPVTPKDPAPELDEETTPPDSWYGSRRMIILAVLLLLLMAFGFWAYSTFDQAQYKYSFGGSDLSYSPAAALMRA